MRVISQELKPEGVLTTIEIMIPYWYDRDGEKCFPIAEPEMSKWIIEALTKEKLELTPVLGNPFYVETEKLVPISEAFRFYDPDNSLLLKSIGEVGQLNPVVVLPQSNGQFGYISGRRRIEACKALGIKVLCVFGSEAR